MNPQELMKAARDAMKNAYVPYSHFQVGAALLCADGRVYTGCNVENASYGATNCAERTAFFKAISEGEREFIAIAVCGGKEGVITQLTPPCGICRQVMVEFCKPDFKVYLTEDGCSYQELTLQQLLPYTFDSENLE